MKDPNAFVGNKQLQAWINANLRQSNGQSDLKPKNWKRWSNRRSPERISFAVNLENRIPINSKGKKIWGYTLKPVVRPSVEGVQSVEAYEVDGTKFRKRLNWSHPRKRWTSVQLPSSTSSDQRRHPAGERPARRLRCISLGVEVSTLRRRQSGGTVVDRTDGTSRGRRVLEQEIPSNF